RAGCTAAHRPGSGATASRPQVPRSDEASMPAVVPDRARVAVDRQHPGHVAALLEVDRVVAIEGVRGPRPDTRLVGVQPSLGGGPGLLRSDWHGPSACEAAATHHAA